MDVGISYRFVYGIRKKFWERYPLLIRGKEGFHYLLDLHLSAQRRRYGNFKGNRKARKRNRTDSQWMTKIEGRRT